VPDVKRVWELDVLLEGTAKAPLRTLDGAVEPLTGAQLSSALWTAKGVKGTVTYVDVDGTSYQVYVGELREAFAKIAQRDGRQLRGQVVLVEA
jgi:hypothetical protein